MRNDRARTKEDYDPTNTRHSTWVDKMCELFISQQHRSDHDKILTNIDHFQIPRNSVPRANLIHESERTNKNHISCECTSQMLRFATKIPFHNPNHSQRNATHLRSETPWRLHGTFRSLTALQIIDGPLLDVGFHYCMDFIQLLNRLPFCNLQRDDFWIDHLILNTPGNEIFMETIT